MFGKKQCAIIMALILAVGTAFPAFAASPISSVSLKITSDIEPDSDYGDVTVTVSNSRYYVDEAYVTNAPSGEWRRGTKPRVKITLGTDESSYYFKSGFSKSNVSLSGTEATVTSVSRSSSTQLVINVTLGALTGNNGEYDLGVYDLEWDENSGQAYWEGGGDAKRYELKVYRAGTLLNSSTISTNSSNYNFASYITRSGTYSFKVRAVYNGSYKGDWVDSGEWYVDSETARGIKNTASTGGPSNSNTAGAWLRDNVGWWYCNADRSYTVNNWQYINNKWYFFDSRGYMVTGWVLWKNVYYYCGPDGDMWTNAWTPDGYYVDGNGVWVQGYRR
ncbi:MAG: hypothetical protein HFG73_10855 [Hungatella sp.]|nr:hypothetical protein [Hungatella sp.]